MIKPPDLESLRKVGLYPHQARFIIDFIEKDSEPFQRLLAPPGTGKTHMACHLIHSIIDVDLTAQVLVITAHRVLVDEYMHRLRKLQIKLPVIPIDKKKLRLLEAEVPVDESPFSRPIVALVAMDFAINEQVAQALLKSTWALVVVDEVQDAFVSRKRTAFIERLLKADNVERLLLLSTPLQEVFNHQPFSPPGTHTVEWSGEILDWEGKPLFASSKPLKRLIVYKRTSEEIAFLNALKELKIMGTNKRKKRMKKVQILRLASSSLYAIEQSLSRKRDSVLQTPPPLSRESPIEGSGREEDSEDEILEKFEYEDSEIQTSLPTEEQLTDLLTLLDRVPEDIKLQAISNLLANYYTENPKTRFCVITQFVSTLDYLSYSLGETGKSVLRIFGGMPSAERMRILEEFIRDGEILIATPAAIAGMNWRSANIDVLVNYDLPGSDTKMAQRMAIVMGSKKPTVYAFKDTSKVLPIENRRLLELGFEEKPSSGAINETGSTQLNPFE